MTGVSEQDLDGLYQVPPAEFTAARNALAKRAGADAPRVKALKKPPLAAWAINQLYWHDRPTYEALIDTSTALRKAHAAVLKGQAADLREARRDHEEAVAAALRAALGIIRASGERTTDATRQAIATTLRALPAEARAGRLDTTLQPAGFEALAGLSIAAAGPSSRAAKPVARGPAATPPERGAPREPARSPRAKQELARAARDVRTAEHAAGRAEFEAARTARDAEKAAAAVDAAREAAAEADARLAEALRAAEKADTSRAAAERRAREADGALARARERLDRLR